MALTAPELSIDTSAPWVTLSLSPLASISAADRLLGDLLQVQVDGGIDDEVAA